MASFPPRSPTATNDLRREWMWQNVLAVPVRILTAKTTAVSFDRYVSGARLPELEWELSWGGLPMPIYRAKSYAEERLVAIPESGLVAQLGGPKNSAVDD
jgi:hypothetical protein